MNKVTKKELARKLQHQESRIDRLVEKLARKGFYDDEQEQADHDEVLIILDSKEPKLKALDQSVFDGLSNELRFASVDDDGRVFAFDVKPELMSCEWDVPCHKICQFIDDNYDASNWQNSLIERKELTGSDLARAMLERGDKYVMCHIGINKNITVITGWNGNGFTSVTNQDSLYLNPTPINNQGEPLTQSEAGL